MEPLRSVEPVAWLCYLRPVAFSVTIKGMAFAVLVTRSDHEPGRIA
jgi:hypothetical protein